MRIEALSRALFDGVDGGDGQRRRIDLGVLLYCADERPLWGLAALVDWRCNGALTKLVRQGFCTGAADEAVLLPGRRDLPAERWILYGLGPARALDPGRARRLAERAVSTALRLNPRELLLALPGATDDRELAESMLTGVVVAAGGVAPTFVHGDDVGTAVAERPRALTHEGDDGAAAPSDDDGETLAHVESAAAESHASAPRCALWVVADGRHAGRLRRFVEGPPRAADE